MFKQKPKKPETKNETAVREGAKEANRPLVEAMKVKLEHEMPAVRKSKEEEQLAKLQALTVEVRGGGVPGPFEAVLTEVGARAVLDCLK